MTRHPAIIVDIDGTLANTDHRVHHIERSPKNWEGWRAAADADELHADVALVVTAAAEAMGAIIVACSGRMESERDQTLNWFERHQLSIAMLYMRPDGDFRADHIVKRELLDCIRADGFHPLMVFDDRSSVVAMWREAGLRCFQVAPGDF